MSNWTLADLQTLAGRKSSDQSHGTLPSLRHGKLKPATDPDAPGKYRRSNRADRTYEGVVYDSKREATHAAYLDVLRICNRVLKVERQVPFDLIVNGIKVCKIVIDFRVTYHNFTRLEEVKGFETPLWKLKWKLFRALYPDLDCEVVK